MRSNWKGPTYHCPTGVFDRTFVLSGADAEPGAMMRTMRPIRVLSTSQGGIQETGGCISLQWLLFALPF